MAKTKGESDTSFAKVLTKLMSDHKLSVKGAAAIAGIPPSTISSWRAGVAPTQFTAVKKLAAHFGVSMAYLLTGERDSASGQIPEIEEIFSDGGSLFDGYAKITIQRLLPRKPRKPGGD